MADLWKIAGVQMDVAIGNNAANLDRMTRFVEQTANDGAALTVFPECALPGYCFDSREEAMPFAETIPGPSTDHFARVCSRLRTHVIYGLLERDGNRLFNATVLVGPSGVVGSYRKIHLPFLGIDRFTTPGDRPFAVHGAGAIRVGMHICYDGAFPEAARVMALAGADLLVLPTNWPPGAECVASCVINARAMENNVYFLAVNRIGEERGFTFIGRSKICGPDGNVLAEAPHTQEAVLTAEIDLERARRKRIVRVPEKHIIHRFADRRPEMYAGIVAPVKRGE